MMVGLRTQEENRFIKFFKLIQNEADKMNSVFFLDSGEGHSTFYDDIICTNCSGWLVPKSKADDFQKEYENFKDNECWKAWEDYVAWVTWDKSDNCISVHIELLGTNYDLSDKASQ